MIYPNINAERARAGMSNRAIANELHITERTFYNWMRGKGEIPASALVRMARMWGVSADYLLKQNEAGNVVQVQD